MANISDAAGTATFFANSRLDLKWIHKLFQDVCSKWDYNTDFGDIEEYPIYTQNSYVVDVPFSGSGRWTYLNNIENMLFWVKNSLERDGMIPELCKLETTEFSIRFEFTDYEPGCEVLYEATAQISNGINTGPEVNIYHTTDYDCTAENLVLLGYFDSVENYNFCNS